MAGIRKGTKKKGNKDVTLCYSVDITDTLVDVENFDPEDLKRAVEIVIEKRLKVDNFKVRNFKIFPIDKEV